MTEAAKLVQRVLGRVVGREREVELVVARARSGPTRAARGAARHRQEHAPARRCRRARTRLRIRRGQRRADARAPRRSLRSGSCAQRTATTPDVFVDGPLVSALRDGSLLYVEEINRIPEETLNVLITVMSERELHVPRLGRVAAAAGFRLVAAMNPFDAVGTARISSAVYDRVCRLSVGYQTAHDEAAIVVHAVPALTVNSAWLDKAVEVVRRTRSHPDVRVGSSVRGAIDIAAGRVVAGRPARRCRKPIRRSGSTARSSPCPGGCGCGTARRAPPRMSSPSSGTRCSARRRRRMAVREK